MTLSPIGALRARWGGGDGGVYPTEHLAALAARDVDEAWLALAHELAQVPPELAPSERRRLLLWVLALYGAMEEGSTRLPDDRVAETLERMGLDAAEAARVAAFAAAPPPAVGALIGEAHGDRPLVHHHGGLSPRAAHRREVRLGRWLGERGGPRALADGDAVEAAIADVVARPPSVRGALMALNAEQIAAVRVAASRALAVISGGPGTGKTSIVVAILRALVRLGVPPARVALAAPTGKAKHRLQGAVEDALSRIVEPGDADRALAAAPPRAETLHRLLGWHAGIGAFAWGAAHRLPYDVVIVDEGSMIDLALADHLVEALADGARLVILGDADQLPSVDVGAVFRDVVARGGDGAVRLRESYRMRVEDVAGRHVYQAAQAINAGDVPALEVVLAAPPPAGGVRHQEASTATALTAALEAWTRDRVLSLSGAKSYFARAGRSFSLRRGLAADDAERLAQLLRHAESHRILCVTRSAARPTGVDAVNAVVRAELRRRRAEESAHLEGVRAPFWAPGDPVLVERNDYARELWNGDFGVVVRLVDGPEHENRLAVAFEPERGRFVFHPLGALRGDITHAWAMTVHKAQGSELDDAMVVLPWDPIPLMTREIVYTAVSRARRSVLVVGPRAVLHRGVERRLLRRSGL